MKTKKVRDTLRIARGLHENRGEFAADANAFEALWEAVASLCDVVDGANQPTATESGPLCDCSHCVVGGRVGACAKAGPARGTPECGAYYFAEGERYARLRCTLDRGHEGDHGKRGTPETER